MKPVRVIKKPREVPRYGSANWEDFRKYVTDNSSEILSAPADSDVNSLWVKFRNILQSGIKKFIPHKIQKSKVGLPYISYSLRKLMRKRDRLTIKLKKLVEMSPCTTDPLPLKINIRSFSKRSRGKFVLRTGAT